MSLSRFLITLAVLCGLALVVPAAAHAQADVIRGRVTDPENRPIEGVAVTATSMSGNVTRPARTDKDGRFTITFPNGDGDYMMNFRLLGYAPKRFQLKRSVDQEILIADTKLQRAAAELDAVTVNAPRDRVSRAQANAPDIGGTERAIEQSALPAADLGDLAAMAASLPGVLPVPGEEGGASGFSVLGLGADQNSTTLNGMNFGGSNLPRDAQVSSSLTTSPYDVSRGGFSGANFNLRTRSGNNFISRGMSLLLDSPRMQWTDAAARALGQQYSNTSLSGMLSGPIVFNKAFYNVSYQLGRRASDMQSLLNTDEQGLQAAGVAADSVRRLLGILDETGIPSSFGRLPRSRLSDQGLVFGTFDIAPPSSSSGQAFNFTFNGSWSRQNPVTPLTAEVPAHSGDRTNWNGGLQARHNNYYWNFLFSETSLGVSQSRSYSEPYITLPDGSVRVNSTFEDGSNGVRTLAFGGNQGLDTRSVSTNASLMNQLSWFSGNNKHRLKLTTELRHEMHELEQSTNLLGSFSYNSLADLQNNTPSRFTRQLTPRERTVAQLTAGASLGDAWRVTPDLQVQYGVRVDANRLLHVPDVNTDVERIFGVRNDAVPSNVYFSPRIGFSWTYGQAPQIGAFEGAFRGPRAVVRGGIGIFQNSTSAQMVGQAIDNTGLPSGVQTIQCVGPATPIPDWAAYAQNPASIPTRCADGTAGTVFSNTLPSVTLFAPDYAPQRSLRSNLSWSSSVLKNTFYVNADVTYSRNLNQSGFVDLNFNPATQFTLADEAGRPVYVKPTSIVPGTGAIASRDARVSSLFSRVTQLRSDLTSETRQLSLGISPVRYSSTFGWRLNYVYSDAREQVRGFSSTVGNPFDVEWARGTYSSRHQIQYGLNYNLLDAVRISWSGSFRSGMPYTPVVGGDVNGDGYSNDRAFVFDPADAADPDVAAGIRNLLANGSSSARECLTKQLGGLAGRNSCVGPWTSYANLSFSFNPLKVRMPQRTNISFSVSNPLGAADLLLHGEKNLKGWGQANAPDPALLYVRGFDPNTNRYRYEVNQRFGATSPAFSAIRAPVTLTAMVRFDIGPTRERQMLTQTLDVGRKRPGTPTPEAGLKAMYSSGGVINPLTQILRSQDTLSLTPQQADSIASMNRRYMVRLDSIWTPVAKYLATLPSKYDHDEAYDRYRSARRSSIDLLIATAPTVSALLTDEQKRKLPAFIASLLDPKYLVAIRNGTAGQGMGGMPMMGAPMVMPAGAAGGTRTIIIQ